MTKVIWAQQVACGAAVVEARTRPKELFEDALTVCSASYPTHDEELIQNFDEVSNMLGDPNKILQILVNLIGNARDSMRECKDRRGRLTLCVQRLPDENIRDQDARWKARADQCALEDRPAHARELARLQNVPAIIPDLPRFATVDSSHFDQQSIGRFAPAWPEALAPLLPQ